ncbi:hypothetical protein H2204_003085 [Knufia peltigerae]|uniref:Uncharacterized protein n=1 Tax=Knufia peltigerae TaxID=1002370 RepID=A0AA38YAB8_9EURO|nr:hypothetical protein H2204_003085 [Knufia peltigerae]
MAATTISKSFVVTGGASGIGLATAVKLLRSGATVHVVDRASSLPPQLEGGNKKSMFYYGSVDVASRTSVRDTFSKIFSRSPDIYGLVNSAGIVGSSGVRIESDEAFERTMAVNVQGTWNCATEFLRHVETNTTPQSPIKEGRASIVNIGSSATLKGFPTLAAYCASKHAVLGLTRTWAEDFAPLGVRVNLIAPGGIDTPLTRSVLARAAAVAPDGGKQLEAHAAAMVPLKREGRPEEIAEAIVFLLQDTASFITGQVLPVNGGYP